MVVKVDADIEAEPISKSECFDILRKLFRSWHLSVAHQDRNNRKLVLQSVSDLETNKIRWVVDSPFAMLPSSYPVRPDYRDQNFGLTDDLFDVFPKIDAVRNGIEVHENLVPSEFRLKPVIQPSGDGQGIFAAIRDRDHCGVIAILRNLAPAGKVDWLGQVAAVMLPLLTARSRFLICRFIFRRQDAAEAVSHVRFVTIDHVSI